MTIKSLRLVFLLFLFASHINAQEKQLTNEAIWNWEFSQKTLESIHPLTTQSAYTVLKVDYQQQQSKIILYDYATAEELAVLVDSSASAAVPFFTGYSFSADENKILLETEVERIYRRSKRAEFWIYDLTTKKVDYLFSGKVQQARFSPK